MLKCVQPSLKTPAREAGLPCTAGGRGGCHWAKVLSQHSSHLFTSLDLQNVRVCALHLSIAWVWLCEARQRGVQCIASTKKDKPSETERRNLKQRKISR